MSRYKGRALPDGKIQILQDGKNLAIVDSKDDAKKLIAQLDSSKPALPMVEDTKPAYDPAPFILFALGIFVCFIGLMIMLSMVRQYN